MSLSDLLSRLKAYWHGHRFAADGMTTFDPGAEEKAHERRALILTIAMHLLLVLFLVISINWKNSEPQAMQAEIWTPQQLAAATAAAQREVQTFGDPTPEPTPPKPEPKPEPTPPKPEPKPQPKPEPKPEPKPQPKPEPAKTPVNPKADIAVKQDKKAEKDKAQDKTPDKKDAKAKDSKETKDTKDDKKKPDPKKKSDDFLEELKREEQKLAAQKQQASQKRAADARAQKEAAMRAQAGAEAKATGAERARGDDRSYLAKLKTKIRGNVILPPGLQGNPASVFRVTQLPSGEVIDVRLIKSSGNLQLDAAVERAIRKSSPLPTPEGRSPDRIIDITYLPFEKPPQ